MKTTVLNYRVKIVPGNSSNKDMAKLGKNTFILGTSVVEGRRMKEFTQHLKNSIAQNKIIYPCVDKTTLLLCNTNSCR